MDNAQDGWSQADQAAGFSLPSRCFFDETIHRRERGAIFFKSWHLVGHASELREPGAFVTHDIFDQSVLVMSGSDGTIRAFHKVCQHRCNRLVEKRRGLLPVAVCGYHAWTYGTDGSLRGATRSGWA